MVPILQVKIYPIITQNVRVTSVHVLLYSFPKYSDLDLGSSSSEAFHKHFAIYPKYRECKKTNNHINEI